MNSNITSGSIRLEINFASRLVIVICLFIFVGVSFWCFSRFTVDDAFISWRYGKNLVDFGVWNYNPAFFDMTQAYTNPLYAILSIIPNALNIDVVFFFKMFSLLVILIFILWFYLKARNSLILLLIFFALPATIIHGFGGLETILFVFLFAALMISMYEKDMKSSIIITLLLFFTRPESWIFLAFMPAYYLIDDNKCEEKHSFGKNWLLNYLTGISFSWKKSALVLLWIGAPLFLYFVFHYFYFDSALPNSTLLT